MNYYDKSFYVGGFVPTTTTDSTITHTATPTWVGDMPPQDQLTLFPMPAPSPYTPPQTCQNHITADDIRRMMEERLSKPTPEPVKVEEKADPEAGLLKFSSAGDIKFCSDEAAPATLSIKVGTETFNFDEPTIKSLQEIISHYNYTNTLPTDEAEVKAGDKVWAKCSGKGPYIAITQTSRAIVGSKDEKTSVDGWYVRDTKGCDTTLPTADLTLVEPVKDPSGISSVIFCLIVSLMVAFVPVSVALMAVLLARVIR